MPEIVRSKKTKLCTLQFEFEGKRRTISFGRLNDNQKKTISYNINALIKSVKMGVSIDEHTKKWIEGVDKKLVYKLEKIGIIKKQKTKNKKHIIE